MTNYLRNFKNKKFKNNIKGVPAEKAGGHFVSIFFSDKNLKKGFSLHSLTQLEIEINIPKSILKSITAMVATEYAKFAKHFNKKILAHFAIFYLVLCGKKFIKSKLLQH